MLDSAHVAWRAAGLRVVSISGSSLDLLNENLHLELCVKGGEALRPPPWDVVPAHLATSSEEPRVLTR